MCRADGKEAKGFALEPRGCDGLARLAALGLEAFKNPSIGGVGFLAAKGL